MLFKKTTLQFNDYQKGWIPETDVFSDGAPKNCCADVVNLDFDYTKGGLVKSCGYNHYDHDQSNPGTDLVSIDLAAGYTVWNIGNYSLGYPEKKDYLLVILYNAAGSPKYKWYLKDHHLKGSTAIYLNVLFVVQSGSRYDAIFNPNTTYTDFVYENINNVLRVGLGKDNIPIWIGYIKRDYFCTKPLTDPPVYLKSYNGFYIAERNLIPIVDNISLSRTVGGSITKKSDIEIYVTAIYDGFQEVPIQVLTGNIDNIESYLDFSMPKTFWNSISKGDITFTDDQSDNQYYLNLYMEILNGTDQLFSVYFVDDLFWSMFCTNIAPNFNGEIVKYNLFIRGVSSNLDDGFWIKRANVMVNALNGGDGKLDLSNPDIENSQYFGDGHKIFKTNKLSAWITTANIETLVGIRISRLGSDVSNLSLGIAAPEGTDIQLPNTKSPTSSIWGSTSLYEILASFNVGAPQLLNAKFDVAMDDYQSIDTEIDYSIDNNNLRITAFNFWARYKPATEDTYGISNFAMYPYFLVKTIELCDTNNTEKNNTLTTGWVAGYNYKTNINFIPSLDVKDPKFFVDDSGQQIPITAIPQLLPRIIYEPDVPWLVKYGVSTIHAGTSYVADTDNDQEVMRFSRMGGYGTNELDVFSYDFNSAIGFETVGSDSPGYITNLQSFNDELVILKSNSIFIMKTDVGGMSLKQVARFVGCNYPRSVVNCKYGIIFADDKGIWWYPGGGKDLIQLNWQWDIYYKSNITKTGMFATWNGQTEEYWLWLSDGTTHGRTFVADFKNIAVVDQSINLMKEKEKIIVPWRKREFNVRPLCFTCNSTGDVYFSSASNIYKIVRNVFHMEDTIDDFYNFPNTFIENHAIDMESPLETAAEVFVTSEPDIFHSDWYGVIELKTDNQSYPRERVIMAGNNLSGTLFQLNKPVDVKPVNVGYANLIKAKLILDDTPTVITHPNPPYTTLPIGVNSSHSQKKIRSWGLNIVMRTSKYVTE